MKLGTLDVEKIYLGNDEISKIYLGSTSVYENSTPQSEGSFFAYTDTNDNTIYTPDANLQGTFKSLNTNDFDNIGSTIAIDNNGIATCGGYAETSYFKSKTALFGTGTNDNWQIHSRMAYRENLADNTNLYGVHPWVEFKDVILFKPTSDISTIALEIGDGSTIHDINYSSAGPTAINEFFTSDLIGYANGTSFKTNNSFGETTSYKVNFSGSGSYFGRANILLDLTDTYCVSNGKKTTLAIMNTTSTIYNSSWQQLSGAEHYNDIIKIGSTIYTRDSSKDIAAGQNYVLDQNTEQCYHFDDASTYLTSNYSNGSVYTAHIEGSGGSSPYTLYSSSEKKFGAGSLYAYMVTQRWGGTQFAHFENTSSSYTVDFWYKASSYVTGMQFTLGSCFVAFNNDYTLLSGDGNTTTASTYITKTAAYLPTLRNGSWHHLALVKDSTNAKLYAFLDGIKFAECDVNSSYITESALNVWVAHGDTHSQQSYDADEYIDEMRITNKALWTSDFAVPTHAYEVEN